MPFARLALTSSMWVSWSSCWVMWMSTTLVDIGDLEHRLTLIRDEPVVHGDLVYIFEDLVVIDESSIRDHSDVGDAYLGAVIHVRTLDGTTVGTVEPGMLGSMRRDPHARRWIVCPNGRGPDRDLRWNLSRGLMQTMSAGTLDDVDRIRVTIYDLPASHAVWLGWSIMLIGMAPCWSSVDSMRNRPSHSNRRSRRPATPIRELSIMEEGTIVHVDYDLWNAETEDLIETRREAIAEEHGMDTTNRTFQPMVAIVGHGALIEGFEDALLEAEPDKDYSITIEPDKAYGEKDRMR